MLRTRCTLYDHTRRHIFILAAVQYALTERRNLAYSTAQLFTLSYATIAFTDLSLPDSYPKRIILQAVITRSCLAL
jgi:hypothetical protein